MDVFVYVESRIESMQDCVLYVPTCVYLSCPPPEFYRLLDSIIKKQGICHATDRGTGASRLRVYECNLANC